MKILQVAAEMAPFAKVGGLADMTGSLPKAWSAGNHTVLPVLPLYGNIDRTKYEIEQTDLLIPVPYGTWTEYATVFKGKIPGTSVDTYFLRSADYFDRPGIYGYHEGFVDNDRRFIFLCRAAFELARALNFKPDIIHGHDYHTAPLMPMLSIHYRSDPFFEHTASVYTIHNMAYQGVYDPQRAIEFCGFRPQDFFPGSWFEHNGAFNAMKAGIMFADKITTVSPSYAEEIRWTEEGFGMQPVLQQRTTDLIGVLNGIDLHSWSPEVDADIAVPYNHSTLEKKAVDKRALLLLSGLSLGKAAEPIPLVGMVSRLTEQKGISLVADVIESIIEAKRLRFIILGSGEKYFEDYFRGLAQRYPEHVFVGIGYSEPFSHRIQAGSDFLLVPSKFEPCGLTQMFAMSYGTVPIVRAIGGLNDTVQDFDTQTHTGTGIKFREFEAEGLRGAIERALGLFQQEPHWARIRRNAMDQDFSIERTAKQYVEVFNWAREKRK
jgi:starch synthase